MATMRLRVPPDFVLARDCCSYGYFLLSPNHWDVREQSLGRPFLVGGLPVLARIDQPKGPGSPLRVRLSRTLAKAERARLEEQVTRMLRLDEGESAVAQFHGVDPRWKESGRGRLFRSPTLFEDVIKTVTSCNVTWPNTIHMNRRLCDVLGKSPGGVESERTFPDARRMSRTRAATLRARCRVGYRDARMVELARLFTAPPGRGGLDVVKLEDPATSDDDVRGMLLELPGVGPYAAANIMQLLGRYSCLPLDTESVRHGRMVLGYTGTPAQVMKKVHAHFAPMGRHAFRSYWFEMWAYYESRHGPAHTWERDSTGRVFTAAQLSREP